MSDAALKRFGGAAILRRALALALMLGILGAFRHLALLFVAFVIFAHALGFLGAQAGRLSGGPPRRGVLIVILLLLTLVGLGVFASVRLGSHAYVRLLEGKALAERVADLQADLLRRAPAWLPLDDIREKAPGLLEPAIVYVRATGQILLQLLIGLILGVVYLLDRGAVDELLAAPPPESVPGLLRRYFGYLGEAVLITIQLQLLVALVNTVLTVPILLLLRLPHLAGFTAVIFFSSLVPVVGNLASGAVLIAASYLYKGLLGVVLFLASTFVLHKIEAYYLNPRLTSRHVHLPALVLIISLILFEHVFGLVGLFLSFPALYVGIKIGQDWKGVLAPAAPAAAAEVAAVDPPPSAG